MRLLDPVVPTMQEEMDAVARLWYLIRTSANYCGFEMHPDGSVSLYLWDRHTQGNNNVVEAVAWVEMNTEPMA
jgi:hypothetical protein